MQAIEAHLFVGSLAAASDCNQLQEHGITHLINLSGMPPLYPKRFTYLTIPLADAPTTQLLPFAQMCFDFVDECLAVPNRSVLIHCAQGRSRSVAMLSLYLMRQHRWTHTQTLQYIRERYPNAAPNGGFLVQMHAFSSSDYSILLTIRALPFIRRKLLFDRRKQGRDAPALASSAPLLAKALHTLPLENGELERKTLPALGGAGFSCLHCGSRLCWEEHLCLEDPSSSLPIKGTQCTIEVEYMLWMAPQLKGKEAMDQVSLSCPNPACAQAVGKLDGVRGSLALSVIAT